MKSYSIYIIGFFLSFIFFSGCEPIEDREDITGIGTGTLDFKIDQEQGRDSKVIFTFNASNANVFWDIYNITSGEKAKFASDNSREATMVFPFKGTYRTIVYGYFKNGMVVDSVDFSTSANDEGYFADPNWPLLTNSSNGKYWKISAKYVGPESVFSEPPAWWQPDISGEAWGHDSIYFDLYQGYNFRRYRDGVKQEDLVFKYDSVALETPIFNGAVVKTLSFNADHSVLPDDDAAEMGSMYNTFKIAKLTEDTLIVSQGASFIPDRNSEDWSWYWLYTSED